MPAGSTPDLGPRRSGGSGDLRQGNLTQILRYVRDHGASSRHDIAHGCGLGISTMTDLIGELRARRIVMELDPIRRPGAGRPTRPIDFDGEPWCVLGVRVDLDGFEFAAALRPTRALPNLTARCVRSSTGCRRKSTWSLSRSAFLATSPQTAQSWG